MIGHRGIWKAVVVANYTLECFSPDNVVDRVRGGGGGGDMAHVSIPETMNTNQQ